MSTTKPAAGREPYLDSASFNSMLAFRTEEAIPDLLSAIRIEDIDPEDLGYVKRQLFDHRFTVALLLFSGGRPMDELRPALQAALISFEDFLNDEHAPLVYVDLAIQTYYVEALWLLSLTKLLGLGDMQIERVANFYAADETNDGADELFELILAKLGRKSFEAEGLIHEDPYQLLLDCIKAEPDARPALMTQFLKRWFKGQKECDWWGSHVNRRGTPVLDTGFFGYWAFEAALVTYLWDIDDSSYRDLPHYPKDLIDYARQNLSPQSGAPQQAVRSMAGEPCPREGFWVTPAKTNSRRHFKAGEIMPDFKSEYGVTIWQWDQTQT
jgi:Domain of unknown function (DUF1911)/Domain of unknown function (DUF1910)